jgi:hypothetical protein
MSGVVAEPLRDRDEVHRNEKGGQSKETESALPSDSWKQLSTYLVLTLILQIFCVNTILNLAKCI